MRHERGIGREALFMSMRLRPTNISTYRKQGVGAVELTEDDIQRFVPGIF